MRVRTGDPHLAAFAEAEAVLVDGSTGAAVTRADIETRGAELADLLDGQPGLAFLLASNELGLVRDFHALVAAGIPAALIDASSEHSALTALAERYRPELVLGGGAAGWTHEAYNAAGQRAHGEHAPDRDHASPHPDLCVLLTTSGSTGSPKFVRLSRANIAANARQIAASLGLRRDDTGITALPFHYSFGMSVLTSHAAVGSPVVVTSASVLEPALWEQMAANRVSFLPGVPQTYQMLRRLGFAERDLPHLRALIQAGGRLDPALVAHFAEAMESRGGEFFVMYGQTEAAPRMTCLPPARLAEKLGSAGVALPEARLSIRAETGEALPPGEAGEVFFTGPNVMMGYAEHRDDLALADTTGDTLATGDLGYLDADGYLFLTGRSKRIAKVAGLRISLDEVEAMVPELAAAAVEVPAGTIALATTSGGADGSTAARALAKALRVPPKNVKIHHVAELPLLPSGKVDYGRLTALLGSTHEGAG